MAHQSELPAPSRGALQHVKYFSEELKPAFRAETYKLCVVRAAFRTRKAGFFTAKDCCHEPSHDYAGQIRKATRHKAVRSGSAITS